MMRPLLVSALLAATIALASCQKSDPPKKEDVAVEILKVHKDTQAQKVGATGEIVARTQADLSFRVGGRMTKRAVDIGDHVQKGQLLAQLDPEEQRAALASAKADLELAKSQMDQAERNLARQRVLFANSSSPRSVLDKAEESSRVSQSNFDRAVVGVTTAEEQLAHTQLRTKSDGTVTSVGAEVGQVVQPTQAVFSIAEDSGRDVSLNVSERLLLQADFKEGASVDVSLLASPDVKARGTVREVAPNVDPATGTVRIKISLEDLPQRMWLGASVLVNAGMRSSGTPKATVPSKALTVDRGQPAVWIVDDKTRKVSLRPVTIDRYLNDSVVLDGGVEDGDTVVVAGTQLLHPDQTVAWE